LLSLPIAQTQRTSTRFALLARKIRAAKAFEFERPRRRPKKWPNNLPIPKITWAEGGS
jgi:hypothetical protein